MKVYILIRSRDAAILHVFEEKRAAQIAKDQYSQDAHPKVAGLEIQEHEVI